MVWTLSEKIVNAVGTGEDPTELVNLAAQSAVLGALTADATELNILDGVTATFAELNYVDLTTLGTGAASKAVVLDASGDYTYPAAATIVMPSGGTETFASGSTLTVAGTLAISGATTSAPVIIPDATPYTVLAANSGKTHIVSEQTSTITLNLPVIATGLNYRFVMGGVANEAQNWVFVATTPSFWNGGVCWLDQDSATDNVEPVYGNGSSHLTFTVVTPCAGTTIEVYANATPEWVLNGQVNSPTTPTMA